MKALVVEDDPSVAEPLIAGLERNGIEVAHVAYAAHVLDAFAVWMSSYSISAYPMVKVWMYSAISVARAMFR